jgi:hypothetical protein
VDIDRIVDENITEGADGSTAALRASRNGLLVWSSFLLLKQIYLITLFF